MFKFPGSYLATAEPVDHQVVYSGDGFKVSIASDLPAYFEQEPAEALHYSIDVSLRSGVRSTYGKAVEQANQQSPAEALLFVVIEEYAEVPPTVLKCYEIDEYRDGKAIIEGGRKGERALLAFQTSDGSWPDFRTDMHSVNAVLAAFKVEQNVTGHIEALCSYSCFVSSERQAVYIMGNSGGLSASARLGPFPEWPDLRKKADRIGTLLQRMISDSEPVSAELFDSILLDKTKDDSYLRLWYLRLWQALEDAEGYLWHPQRDNINTVIAGEKTPKELKEYRNAIAHWHTGKIDYAYLEDLQRTAMELLCRKYNPAEDGESDPSERHLRRQ